MKVAGNDTSNVTSWEELRRYSSLLFRDILLLLNNKLLFSDNFDAVTVSAVFNSANSETSILHNLGRIPVGYILQGASSAMQIYDGTTASDPNTIYLQSSATGTARLLIY